MDEASLVELVEVKLTALRDQLKSLSATMQAVNGAIQVCEQLRVELSSRSLDGTTKE